jgi:hypothetical protein
MQILMQLNQYIEGNLYFKFKREREEKGGRERERERRKEGWKEGRED